MPETKLTQEEQEAMTKAREASNKLLERTRAGVGVVDIGNFVYMEKDEPRVMVIVPRPFNLTIDQDHRQVRFPAGPQSIPAALAEHWYVKANGVKPFEAGAAAAAVQDGRVIEKTVEVALAFAPSFIKPVTIGDNAVPAHALLDAAYKATGLSPLQWNQLTDEDRDTAVRTYIINRKKELAETAERNAGQGAGQQVGGAGEKTND